MSARDRWDYHVGARAELHRSMWLCGFYRWCALRGHPAAGAHPITGIPYRPFNREDQALSRAVHLSLARFYLAKARDMQALGVRVLP